MRAGTRVTASFAMLALLVTGFTLTVRVCGITRQAVALIEGAERERVVVRSALPASHAPLSGDRAGSSESGISRLADLSHAMLGLVGGARPESRMESAQFAAREVFDRAAGKEAGLGQLEVHRLSVWDVKGDSPHLYISFTPVSLERFFDHVPMRRTLVDDVEISVADVAPMLDRDHVHVILDDRAVGVLALDWYYEEHSDLSGADPRYMPVCIIQLERPALLAGEHRVHIRIEDAKTGAVGEGSTTFECGPRSEEL